MSELAGQTDLVTFLDGETPVDTTPLRERIKTMDSANRDHLLGNWGDLPDLADDDYESLLLPPSEYGRVEQYVATHEPSALNLAYGLHNRYDAMPVGSKVEVDRRLHTQGFDSFHDQMEPMDLTLGRAMTVEQILNDVTAEANEQVADALGLLPDPGDIITTPVADAEALADIIDWANLGVPDVLMAVALHPERAAEALAAEQAGKNRKGVITKLVPLVGTLPDPAADIAGEVPEPTTATAVPTSPVSPSDGGWASARHSAPSPSVDLPVDGVGEPPGPAPRPADAVSMGKYALMLTRLGSEMLTLGKLIQSDLERVEL